jgi:TRAP-type C4-dicarboxylate transport system permease small subunit
MNRLLRLIDGICLAAAWTAAALLAGLFCLSLGEILLRNLFGSSLAISVEYAGYMVAASLLLGSGWTLGAGGHIRVGLVGARLAPALAWALEVAATVFSLALVAYLSWAMLAYAAASGADGVVSYFPSATPLVYPQALLALGPVVLGLALIARLIRLLACAAPPKARA